MALNLWKSIRWGYVGIQVFLIIGCSSVYKSTGQIVSGYSEQEVVPYVAQLRDLTAGCQMAQSMSAFLLSFERVEVDVRRLNIMLSMLAGHCMTEQLWEAELDYHRALVQKNSSDAMDASIRQTRLARLAAERYWQGYVAFNSVFAESWSATEVGAVLQCPQSLSDQDQLYWLVGMLNGLLAIMNDGLAERSAQIPLSTAQQVAQQIQCLQDEQWWGMVSAITAIVDALQIAPSEHWRQQLRQASAAGHEQGIRLASAFAANVYYIKGDMAALKATIRRFSEPDVAFETTAKWAMFDQAAIAYVQAMSDIVWTKSTGSRTPFGKFGRFAEDDEVLAIPDADELDWDSLTVPTPKAVTQ